MTLRAIDLQSASNLDSIRNSCDGLIISMNILLHLLYLAKCPDFSWEEFWGHEVGHRLDTEVDAKDEDAAEDDAAPVDDDRLLLQVPVLQVGGEEQGGAEGCKADDGGDGWGEVEVPSIEPGRSSM